MLIVIKKKNPLVLTFQCVISDFLMLNPKIGFKKKQELFEDFEYILQFSPWKPYHVAYLAVQH